VPHTCLTRVVSRRARVNQINAQSTVLSYSVTLTRLYVRHSQTAHTTKAQHNGYPLSLVEVHLGVVASSRLFLCVYLLGTHATHRHDPQLNARSRMSTVCPRFVHPYSWQSPGTVCSVAYLCKMGLAAEEFVRRLLMAKFGSRACRGVPKTGEEKNQLQTNADDKSCQSKTWYVCGLQISTL